MSNRNRKLFNILSGFGGIANAGVGAENQKLSFLLDRQNQDRQYGLDDRKQKLQDVLDMSHANLFNAQADNLRNPQSNDTDKFSSILGAFRDWPDAQRYFAGQFGYPDMPAPGSGAGGPQMGGSGSGATGRWHIQQYRDGTTVMFNDVTKEQIDLGKHEKNPAWNDIVIKAYQMMSNPMFNKYPTPDEFKAGLETIKGQLQMNPDGTFNLGGGNNDPDSLLW